MYEDIPHLYAPVVTDPAKAVRALKWTVEQMEDRYRQMSSLGVRSLASFNDKVRAAKAKGQPLGRKVQTGYHPETGQPIYEEEDARLSGAAPDRRDHRRARRSDDDRRASEVEESSFSAVWRRRPAPLAFT